MQNGRNNISIQFVEHHIRTLHTLILNTAEHCTFLNERFCLDVKAWKEVQHLDLRES